MNILSYVGGCPMCGAEPELLFVGVKNGHIKLHHISITEEIGADGWLPAVGAFLFCCPGMFEKSKNINACDCSLGGDSVISILRRWNTRMGQAQPSRIYTFPKGFTIQEYNHNEYGVKSVSKDVAAKANELFSKFGINMKGMN